MVEQITAIFESESPDWTVYGFAQPPVTGTSGILSFVVAGLPWIVITCGEVAAGISDGAAAETLSELLGVRSTPTNRFVTNTIKAAKNKNSTKNALIRLPAIPVEHEGIWDEV